MEAMNRLRRETVVDRAIEALLIALCFAASVYGLVFLIAEPIIV